MKKSTSFLLSFLIIGVLSGCSNNRATPATPTASPAPFGKKVKREYFTGGRVRSEFIMDDDTGQNGTLKKYGFDGKLTSIAHIRNGVRDGVETWFDPKGRVLMKVPYANGKKHGVQEAYYENGDIMLSYTYVNGVKHGSATVYNKDGTIHSQVIFDHGRISN